MTDGIGEREVTLSEEFDRLDNVLDKQAEKLQDVDSSTKSGQALMQVANETEQQLSGVAYLVDEYGEEATVRVQGLTAGGYAKVEDRVSDIRAAADGPGNNPGSSRNVWAATGLVDAPFLDGNAPHDYEERLGAVADQPTGVALWLESRVNEESSVEGNFKPLSERLADSSAD